MKGRRAILAAFLSALLPAASAAPAWSAERAVSAVATRLPLAGASVKLPALPADVLDLPPALPAISFNPLAEETKAVEAPGSKAAAALPAERQHTVAGHSVLPETVAAHSRQREGAYAGLGRAQAKDGNFGAEAAASALFDGSAKRDSGSPPIKAAALGVLAPVAILGLSHAALSRGFSAFSYNVANTSSLIFPLPEIHRAFSDAKAIPGWRAVMGAVGAALVGLMNATVLVKPFWGTMHVFIGLGLLAPYVISRFLKKRGIAYAYAAPQQGSLPARLLARVKADKALHLTLATGALLLAASAGIYYGALAFVPHLLATVFSQATVETILFAVQILKAALFAVVFAPDALDMVRGKKPHGFSLWLDLLFILSTSAFVAWGVQSAISSPPGMIRRQYLVHAARNLIEAVAATISVIALRRAARRADSGKK